VLQIEEEEMELELENSLNVKGEEEKKVKNEEVAWIKDELNNQKIKTRAELITFKEQLDDLVGHKRGAGKRTTPLVSGLWANH
jgi:hypothetical protein